MGPEDIAEMINKMWRRIGMKARAKAMRATANGDIELAVKHARYAEACLWRSSGDSEAIDINADPVQP